MRKIITIRSIFLFFSTFGKLLWAAIRNAAAANNNNDRLHEIFVCIKKQRNF